MLSKIEKKIQNPKKLHIELKKIRNKKIVMCHGNFDIVHPGHIRHLSYARSNGEILIVSITADKFIKKGIYRPHVTEKLRALNLASLEFVDFVVIDNNATPIKLIKKLRPHIFAKGVEYQSREKPETIDEEKIMKSIGGKIIFTPGDIVFSSTKIIKDKDPSFNLFKLEKIMKDNKISFSKLEKIIQSFKKKTIHVVGDTIVDTYTYTSLIGGYTKSPTPSVHFVEKKDFIGGAAIVAAHLENAGAKVNFTTVLGKDSLSKKLIKFLKKNKIKSKIFFDSLRPTTNKNTIVTNNNYFVLKIDKLDNTPISKHLTNEISKEIKSSKSDVMVLSDFRHGIFNKYSIPILTKSINKKVLKVADSQVASRWGNICDYKNFDLITPNEKETRFSLADQDSNLSELTRSLKAKCNFKNLLLKLGSRGVLGVEKKSPFTIPSFTQNAIDPVGAGDAMLAYSSLSLSVSKCLISAAIIGSIAAAIECEYQGNMPVKNSLVLKKLKLLKDTVKI